jgi:hypothetical protein
MRLPFTVAVLLSILLFPPASMDGWAQDLIVSPSRGQSNEQMQRDRAECHDRARQQTGFDPLLSPPGAPPLGSPSALGTASGPLLGGIVPSRLVRFNRAYRTCLEGKGYTVN